VGQCQTVQPDRPLQLPGHPLRNADGRRQQQFQIPVHQRQFDRCGGHRRRAGQFDRLHPVFLQPGLHRSNGGDRHPVVPVDPIHRQAGRVPLR
jgi:hypothetical protein